MEPSGLKPVGQRFKTTVGVVGLLLGFFYTDKKSMWKQYLVLPNWGVFFCILAKRKLKIVIKESRDHSFWSVIFCIFWWFKGIWCFCTLDAYWNEFMNREDYRGHTLFTQLCVRCFFFFFCPGLFSILLGSVFAVTVKAALFCSCQSNLISLIVTILKWNIYIRLSALTCEEDKHDIRSS